MKYSKNFERDFEWYMKYRDVFNFDADPNTDDKIKYDPINGASAKYCFYMYDSQGKIIPTHEYELLYSLFKCKGGINFQIKMWAEDRGKGFLGKFEFMGITQEFELLDWMIEAVERQKKKYWPAKTPQL